MFSQTVEYALRAVVFLASGGSTARTTDQIAAATKVPRAYLSKVLQALTKGGIVKTQRGLGGGITLASTPDRVTILEVVNAVEPVQRIATCPLSLASHGTKLCPLHRRMDNALASVESAFRNTTLAEVLADPSTSIPLCDFSAETTETPRENPEASPASTEAEAESTVVPEPGASVPVT